MPRSRVRIFRNEHTRSTPLDPKIMFCCVSYRLGALGTVRLPYETRCKTGVVQKFVPRSRIGIFRNESTRPTPLEPKLMFAAFRTVWVHLRPFGRITKLGAKHFELVQKFVRRSHVGVFLDECTRSTPLDPNLMCLVRFIPFGCIWDRLLALRNSVQNGPN